MADVDLELGAEVFRLTILGQPAGAGSKVPMPKGRMVGGRFVPVLDKVGRPVFYVKPSSEKTDPWMVKVAEYAQAQKAKERLETLDGALWLRCTFYELRPAGHFKKDGTLRPAAPAFPHQTTTHDRDKMTRALSDSLTRARVIADDKRVIGGAEVKLYADGDPDYACAVLALNRMRYQTVEEAGLVPKQETLA